MKYDLIADHQMVNCTCGGYLRDSHERSCALVKRDGEWPRWYHFPAIILVMGIIMIGLMGAYIWHHR